MELLILAVPSVMTKAAPLSWELKFRLKRLILRLREGAGGGDEEGEEGGKGKIRRRCIASYSLHLRYKDEMETSWKGRRMHEVGYCFEEEVVMVMEAPEGRSHQMTDFILYGL